MSEWGPKHRAEAGIFLLDTARGWLIAATMTPKGTLLLLDASDIRSERAFRNLLVHQVGLQPHEVARAVRRVRGLAEGRLVRERGWRGTSRDGSTLAWTQNPAVARRWRETGARVVRVTRIRKVRP